MNRLPNLFQFATSELSQDAFICWLLAWADKKYAGEDSPLYSVGKRFLDAIFIRCDCDGRASVSIKVERQMCGLDILVLIDDDLALLIEDKITSYEHNDQLLRYKSAIAERYGTRKLIGVYAKTGDQSSFHAVRQSGFVPFLRGDFLDVLRPAREETGNAIVLDFLDRLEHMDECARMFLTSPYSYWRTSGAAWSGFYEWLKSVLADCDFDWNYVPNPRGGFVGAWWHFRNWRGCSLYLQVEEEKLCIKLGTEDTHSEEQRRLSRDFVENVIFQHPLAKQLDLKPSRRLGKYMTVACVRSKPWLTLDSDGVLCCEATLQTLKMAAMLLDQIAGVYE